MYVALLKANLNWGIETDVVTPGVVMAMVHAVLYCGMWRLVVGRYKSTFRRYRLCSSSEREVEAEYPSEMFVALNQNEMRHISGGTDLVELHIFESFNLES